MVAKTTYIDKTWLEENRNKKPVDTVEYLGGKGLPKGLKLAQQSIHAIDQAGVAVGEAAHTFAKNIGTTLKVMGVASIIPDTADAIKSVQALSKDDGVDPSRKSVQAFTNVTGAVSTWGGAALFVVGTPVLGTIAEATGTVSTVTGLGLSYSDYSKAAKLESEATDPEARKAVTHSKNYYFYKVVTTVAKLALTLLGIAAIIIGFELMPALALTLFAIFTICLAIQTDHLKNSGEYKVIEFDREVRLA